jgi:hypothetical protein
MVLQLREVTLAEELQKSEDPDSHLQTFLLSINWLNLGFFFFVAIGIAIFIFFLDTHKLVISLFMR